jgi:hypothetical protein
MDKLNWRDNPEDWEALLAGYALGDLSPEEMDQVQAYLEADPASVTELAKLQATLALLPLSLPNRQPAPELKQRILAAAGEAVVEKPDEAAVPSCKSTTANNNVVNLSARRSRTNYGAWFTGSIAAGLLAVLGFQNYRLAQDVAALRQEVAARQTDTQAQLVKYQQMIAMLRQPDNRLMTLKGMEDKSSGSLVLVPMEKQAVLTLQNVPPLPKGRMYRLWAQVEGKKVYCTEFEPDAEGKVSLTIPLDQLGDARSVTVTIDPQTADTTKPAGEMVMSGTVSI